MISKRLCIDIDCKRSWSLNESKIEIRDDLEFALVDSLNWNMVTVICQIKFTYSNENCTKDFLQNNESGFFSLFVCFLKIFLRESQVKPRSYTGVLLSPSKFLD